MGNCPASSESKQAVLQEAARLLGPPQQKPQKEEAGRLQAAAVDEATWARAFGTVAKAGSSIVTRKDWCIKCGGTHLFDACTRKQLGQLTREEWMQAFKALDADRTGRILAQDLLARRQVHLAIAPRGMGLQHWGVGVGDQFYELLSWSSTGTEMVAVGPSGTLARGDFIKLPGSWEAWLAAARAEREADRHPASAWLEATQEPRARPRAAWSDLEAAGQTSRSAEAIEAWIQAWVAAHPAYRAMDTFGDECNDHTFTLELIEWLTGTPYHKATDNQKCRAIVYGGLGLLAGAGLAYLVKSWTNKAQPQEESDVASTAADSMDEDERGSRWTGGRSRMMSFCSLFTQGTEAY